MPRSAAALAAALVAAVALSLLAYWLRRAWLGTLTFDDAYMFHRYAMNLRAGLGMAWNPDGVPTYGLTNLAWALVVLPFTFLPVEAGKQLQLASCLAGVGGLAVTALAVARHARSDLLRFPPLAFAAVALPLLANPVFAFHLTTGMGTMLSFLANAALAFGLLRYAARPGPSQALLVGVLAFAAVLVRPENGLCALAAPFLVWALLGRGRAPAELLGLSLLPALLIGGWLLACHGYFGVPLPLGFYAKAMHGYSGFLNRENALAYLFRGGLAALPFLVLLAAGLDRRWLAPSAAFLLPVAATFLYLLTVRQVMGSEGRYYMPFLPFLILPALLAAEDALLRRPRRTLLRGGTAAAALLMLVLSTGPLRRAGEQAYLRLVLPEPVPVPALATAADKPLPQMSWREAVAAFGRAVVAHLPTEASLATTEVGYLGALDPARTVIDLAGLNDTRFATEGFSMDGLLARAPDLVWLPHSDYTGLRAAILGDARLFARYRVIDGAFNYGLAIRRDSPFRPAIEARLGAAWAAHYPQHAMADHVARGIATAVD